VTGHRVDATFTPESAAKTYRRCDTARLTGRHQMPIPQRGGHDLAILLEISI
jgi:hypothetical protein